MLLPDSGQLILEVLQAVSLSPALLLLLIDMLIEVLKALIKLSIRVCPMHTGIPQSPRRTVLKLSETNVPLGPTTSINTMCGGPDNAPTHGLTPVHVP